MVLFFPMKAFSQDCYFVKDDIGQLDNIVECKGEIFVLLEKDRAEDVLRKLTHYQFQTEELRLLNSKITLQEQIIRDQEYIIKFLEKDRELNKELLTLALERDVKWHENHWFIVGVTFTLAAATYGYWAYTSR